MRRTVKLHCCVLAKAWVVTLLLAGCNSTEPAAQPEEPAAGLRLEARSDTSLTGTVGTRVDSVPVVRLVTLDGEPAPGREIRFLVSGGGSIAVTSQRTDTAGLAGSIRTPIPMIPDANGFAWRP